MIEIGFLILCLLACVCFFFYAALAMSRKRGFAKVLTAAVVCAFFLAIGAALLLPLSRKQAPRIITQSISFTEESSSNDVSMVTIEHTHLHQTLGKPAKVSPHEVLLEDEVQKALADVDPRLRTVLAGGVLAFLLVLAYLFLDAGRRGRYTWPLRLGTAIVFAGLCVLLWKIGPLM